jgi:hypothetical protein
MSDPILYSQNGAYNYYYAMLGTQGLSWKDGKRYVYLDDSPKPVWIESDTGSLGQVYTGDLIYIRMQIGAPNSMYLSTDTLYIEWGLGKGSGVWQLYTDIDQTPGIPIVTGQLLYFYYPLAEVNLVWMVQQADFFTGQATVGAQLSFAPYDAT